MGLEFSKFQAIGNLQPNIINPYSDRRSLYRGDLRLVPDTITKNREITYYVNPEYVQEAVNTNPAIRNILYSAGIPIRVDKHTIYDLQKNHLPQTKRIAVGVVNQLPEGYRDSVDLRSVQEAAAVHDVGKALIPSQVLNKRGKLDDNEREIMQKHSQLGYEILRNSDLRPQTIELVRNHHQNVYKTGYPEVRGIYISDINSQILHASDVYSALREVRPYKNPMSKNEALAIIHEEVRQGKMHPYVFKALVDYANEAEALEKTNANG